MNALSLLAATNDEMSGAGVVIYLIFVVALTVLLVASMWKVFVKAGKPGWAALIPIYNTYVVLKVVGRPGWWLLLYLVPFVNIIVHLVVSIDLAKSFGKDTAFGVLAIWLFSFIGYPMLGFGEAQYRGPAAGTTPQAPAAAAV